MGNRKGNDLRDKPTRPVRVARKRLLNVIYFIDSKRTRTLQISLKTAALSVGILGVMITWSLIASGLLVNELVTNSNLRDHTRKLLSNIFNYQMRYDNVYEKAYPDHESTVSAFASTESSLKSTETAKPVEDSAETTPEEEINQDSDNILSLAAKEIPENTAKQPPVAKSIEKPKSEGTPPIAIENFSSALNDQILTVRFSLKNLEKRKKTTGTVNARALFVDENKNIRFIRMRIENDTAEASSENDSPSSDQHFNIRYYKNKVFHFDKPTDVQGSFTEVVVAIEDEAGRMKEFTYKITPSSSNKTKSIQESSNRVRREVAEPIEANPPTEAPESTAPYALAPEPTSTPKPQ